MKFRRFFSLILVLCLTTAALAGCGSYAKSQSSYSPQAPAAAPSTGLYGNGFVMEEAAMDAEMGEGASAANSSVSPLPANRKFIINVNMDAETDDLDELLASLTGKIAGLGGYIEDQQIHNGSTYASRRYRNASMTVRIPVQQLDAFTDTVSNVSNVVSSSRNTQDVTLSYVDTESRITALKTEQTRLLELMEQAESMSDLLEIEARLTEVRSNLEMYSSRLRVMDNQIDYATIYLSIEEVKEYTPVAEKTRLEEIRDGFVQSLKDLGNGILDFFSAILIDLPYLVFLALIVLVLVLIGKVIRKKYKAAKTKKLAARFQAMQARQAAGQKEQKNTEE